MSRTPWNKCDWQPIYSLSNSYTLLRKSEEVYTKLLTQSSGVVLKIECDADGNIHTNQAWNLLIPVNVNMEKAAGEEPTTEANPYLGSVAGKIKDASTGVGVKDADLIFRKGSDIHSGGSVAEFSTDANGNYFAKIDEGNYCVEVRKTGYIAQFENVVVQRNVNSTGQDIVISTKMNGEIRIVLTWNAEPQDLDSYLEGTTDAGTTVDINYMSKTCTEADLDVDDIDGYGPETVTIHDINGVYDFYVHDYRETGQMAAGGASVTIYLPDNTSQTVMIGTISDPNRWDVCTIDHGKVTITNH